MTHSFTAHYRIRQYELDARDELPNRVLAHLFQETAMRASADAGFGVEWYLTHSSVWVIREMLLEHLRPVHYLDELAITTWVSGMQRVRAYRECLARNAATGEIVAAGHAYWAHLDRQTGMPSRIPARVFDQTGANGITAVQHLEARHYPAPVKDRITEWRTTRHVQHYEADGMQHVNNAIYYDWLEEPLAEIAPAPLRLCVRRHDIEYVRGALPGDDVEIVTRLVGAGHCATSWEQEITRAGEVVVRNHCIAVCMDPSGRMTRWPGGV